jgi:hypothetical protein
MTPLVDLKPGSLGHYDHAVGLRPMLARAGELPTGDRSAYEAESGGRNELFSRAAEMVDFA